MWHRFLLICKNFNFDFLVLHQMYFQSYFVWSRTKLESLTSHLQHSHPCCIRPVTIVFGSSLHIRHNTAAHIVNTTSTCKYHFKNSLIIHDQNTKKIIIEKETLYVIKQASPCFFFTKRLPRFFALIKHPY